MIGGKFGLGSLLKNAKKIQDMMQNAQSELAKLHVTGESGAGLVRVEMSAQHDVQELILDESLLKESLEVIQELIKAALNDANQKILKITQEKILNAGALFSNNNTDDEKE